MKLAYEAEGKVFITVPINLEKTLAQYPDAVEVTSLPSDDLFQPAWKLNGTDVVEDLVRSKEVAHELRRAHRETLFAPLDALIAKQIPTTNLVEVEQQRQTIRDGDTIVQSNINNAVNLDELRSAIIEYIS